MSAPISWLKNKIPRSQGEAGRKQHIREDNILHTAGLPTVDLQTILSFMTAKTCVNKQLITVAVIL
jgi:hypothetical protein